MSAKGVFINYRRSDTEALAGRIQERMAKALVGRKVFLDSTSIELGSNFEETIETKVKESEIVLVLIGGQWLETGKSDTNQRLWRDDDYVRLEIAWALQNERRVIPILVDDTRMPDAGLLPPDIRALTKQHAAEIRNRYFDDDIRRLIDAIDGSYAGEKRSSLASIIVGAVIGLALLLGILSLHSELTGEPISTRLGIVGAFLLVPLFLGGGGYIGNRYWKSRQSKGQVG